MGESAAALLNKRNMTDTVAEHLLKVGSITALEAGGLYFVRSLARRVKDLRELGWQITSVRKTAQNGQRYVRYVLDETDRQNRLKGQHA